MQRQPIVIGRIGIKHTEAGRNRRQDECGRCSVTYTRRTSRRTAVTGATRSETTRWRRRTVVTVGGKSGCPGQPRSGRRSFEVAIDANDPQRLRRFWKAALGHVKQTTPEGAIDLVDPAGRRPTIWFQQVPEPKTVKNRLHFGPTRHGCRTRSTHPTAHRPARRDPGASPVHRHGRSGRKRTIPHRGLNSTR